MRKSSGIAAWTIMLLMIGGTANSIDPNDTRMMEQPAISQDHIAFIYAHISPSGARAVFDFRGEIITAPGDKGDPRNITGSPGVHEKYPAWSPDGKWIAYTRLTGTNFQRVYLYSVVDKQSHAITDGLSDATEPVFDRGVKYLYFFASTDAGPVVNWFDMSNADMQMNRDIYMVTLQKEDEEI
jgi:Tol biopolymer transport system component